MFPPEQVSQRVRLWREHGLTAASVDQLGEAVAFAAQEGLTATSSEYVAVLGGAMGLAAEVVLPDTSRAVVKIAPASTMQFETVLYGSGATFLPTLIESGSVDDLIWTVVS